MRDCGRKESLKLPPVDEQFTISEPLLFTVQRQFDVPLWTFRTWNLRLLLFARECFLMKFFQKQHNYGRLWYIVRFVSLMSCCVLCHFNSVTHQCLGWHKIRSILLCWPHNPTPRCPTSVSNLRMAFHRSDLALSLKSSERPRRDNPPKSPRAVLNPGDACWSGFNPFCLGEGVKNGLRSVLQSPTPEPSSSSSGSSHESLPQVTLDQLQQQMFSPIGSSGSDARIYLTQTPFDLGPSTIVWSFPEPTWGQWPCHSFSYCISVMTERDANRVYVPVLDTPESEEPISPVHECTLDGVMHLWLIVPNRPSADGMVQLSEEQMRAAAEFYDRFSLSSLSLGAGADTVTTVKKDRVVDPYDSNRGDDDDNAGYRHYYADAREAGAVLLSCAHGNEVDAVALAVLLLTRHHSRFDSDSDSDLRGYHDRRYRHAAAARGLGARDVAPYTTYQASQVIDDDPRVSHVWKGLLEWQDVERVQAALVSCA
jgi:hypothetical protein